MDESIAIWFENNVKKVELLNSLLDFNPLKKRNVPLSSVEVDVSSA